MNFLNLFNPPMSVTHLTCEEETESGKINREFVCFDTRNTKLQSILAAKMLAKRMGEKVLPFLDKLVKNTTDATLLAKYEKTVAWVRKKTVAHPHLVEYCTHKVLRKMKNSPQLKALPLTYKQIYTDASIAAILHDIGRLSEVDIAQGCVCMERGGFKKHHALISYDILEHADIKPEILLAIKYHEHDEVDEMVKEPLYLTLPPEGKKMAEFYTRMIYDMDITANLSERSIYGIKKCAEFFDPHYIQDYDLTDEHFQNAISGQYLRLKGGHLLDAMMRFVTWIYCIHFTETKELLGEILANFFDQMYKEAWREYDNAAGKDAARLAHTLERITQLEDYAITERMGMPLNTVHRRQIKEQIAKLHSA